MQILKYVSRNHGTGKESGKPYDFTKVSNGLDSFNLSNAPGIGDQIENLELTKGDDIEVEVELSVEFDALRGTIVRVS
jgi:hypothetical protein